MSNSISDMNEMKVLVNKVQNFVESNKYSYIIPEHMMIILLDDEKCINMINSIIKDKKKRKVSLCSLKDELKKYVEDNVEKTPDICMINPTNSYTNLLHAVVSQSAMRSIEPDSLSFFLMIIGNPENACPHFLSKYGIYEKDIQEYINAIRENKVPSSTIKYSVELVALAMDGKIDPLIGRDAEIRRIAQILSRKKSSSVCIVGEAGCGKSCIVEGLALKIANGDAPKALLDKKIYSIDLAGMIAGTKFRGEFEERLETVLKECSADKNAILFIDELHTIVGAGSSDGSMDSANIIKPYISRGQIRIIGATTYDEYKNRIEKDKALCRRFKKLDLKEPSADETVMILKGLRSKYEEFHGVSYPDDVLEYAVSLSDKYITGKFFPDKAVDVIDEIGAKYHSGIKSGSSVSKEDVEEVVCSIANIPRISVESDEKNALKTLGDRIKKSLFGQDEIVDKIVRQIKLSKAGLRPHGKPIMSALLIGSTGCGKTELAKTIASELGIGFTKLDMSEYKEEYSVSKLIGSAAGYVGYEQSGALTEPLIKHPHQVILLDEIEKANKSVYDLLLQVLDEGRLTDSHGREASFKNAIILMTSNVGCANASSMSNSLGFVKDSSGIAVRTKKTIEDAYKKTFSPEFRNRLTDVFYFSNLNVEILKMIVEKNIAGIRSSLSEKGIGISIADSAKQWIADKAFLENAGGRPVERIVNSEITEKIADEVLFGKISERGGEIAVDMKKGSIALKIKPL